MVMPRIDHFAHGMTNREDLMEGIVYVESAINRVLSYLESGDRIRIQREGGTYPQIELEIIKSYGDYADVKDDTGKEYILIGRHEYRNGSFPWLRRNGHSEGLVYRLTILRLVE